MTKNPKPKKPENKKQQLNQGQRDRLCIRIKAMYEAWIDRCVTPGFKLKVADAIARAERVLKKVHWEAAVLKQQERRKLIKQRLDAGIKRTEKDYEKKRAALEKQLQKLELNKEKAMGRLYKERDRIIQHEDLEMSNLQSKVNKATARHSSYCGSNPVTISWDCDCWHGTQSEMFSVMRLKKARINSNLQTNEAERRVLSYLQPVEKRLERDFVEFTQLIEDMQTAVDVDTAKALMEKARKLYVKPMLGC